jgi:hypothetical protein
LDPIVTDGCRGVERLSDLIGRDGLQEPGRRGVVCPDARKAIGLELGSNGAIACSGLARSG